jgi:hypothetical protein
MNRIAILKIVISILNKILTLRIEYCEFGKNILIKVVKQINEENCFQLIEDQVFD